MSDAIVLSMNSKRCIFQTSNNKVVPLRDEKQSTCLRNKKNITTNYSLKQVNMIQKGVKKDALRTCLDSIVI